jgi:hypothetical protein
MFIILMLMLIAWKIVFYSYFQPTKMMFKSVILLFISDYVLEIKNKALETRNNRNK